MKNHAEIGVEKDAVNRGKDRAPDRRRLLSVEQLTPGGQSDALRAVATEYPVAIVFSGLSYAVMMTTPADLEAFGAGFAISEGIVEGLDQIEKIDVAEADAGLLVRIAIPEDKLKNLLSRRRNLVGQTGCGLCGIEDLEAALRPLPDIGTCPDISKDDIFSALDNIARHQPLNSDTGGVHGAAFIEKGGSVRMLMEDVGRHNALDKLIGAMALSGIKPDSGYLLMTSRCSFELVQKATTFGFGLMVSISVATTLAVELARKHRLTLICLARPDSMLVMNDPHERFGSGIESS